MKNNDVIIALDFPTGEKALGFLDRFGSVRPYVKVGMELFYAEGAPLLRRLKERGHRIFLDLKLHDIPNTVRRAMSVLSAYEIDMVNLHAAGSRAMMSAALEGLTRADGSRPLLLAVTVLTSLSDETVSSELLIPHSARETVISYASNAAKAGLDGVVCSPLESDDVHAACGADFLTVTPGIRFSDGAVGDQSRVTTPAMARGSSDYIVVGRPITAADDPAAAYERCRKDFLGEQHDE